MLSVVAMDGVLDGGYGGMLNGLVVWEQCWWC